jgi:RimJ/RimL family protein N-acetyltransferase
MTVTRGAYVTGMELLRTRRLLLRRWQDDDLDAFFDIYSRWEVMRWLGAPPRRAIASVAEARDRFSAWREREAGLAAPFGLWAMVPLDANPTVPIGTTLLMPLHDAEGATDEVEVGWHLHPAYQRQGLATEAAQAVLDAAGAAGLTRVLALTDPDNSASQAVARRLGMADGGLTDRWFGTTTRRFCWDAPLTLRGG